MRGNILCEAVKERLWGGGGRRTGSRGISSETSKICELPPCRRGASEVAQRSGSKLGAQRRFCEVLQSELMSADNTFAHSVLSRDSAARWHTK